MRIIAPYVGGGFGSKTLHANTVLAALAARAVQGRPVKFALTRQQMFALCYRPATIERLALGAQSGGTLDSVTHEAIAVTSQYEDFFRNDSG